MSDRIFVDSNILIYAHDVDAKSKREVARSVLGELWPDRECDSASNGRSPVAICRPRPAPPYGADCPWCVVAGSRPPPSGSTKCFPWHTRGSFACGTWDTDTAGECNKSPC